MRVRMKVTSLMRKMRSRLWIKDQMRFLLRVGACVFDGFCWFWFCGGRRGCLFRRGECDQVLCANLSWFSEERRPLVMHEHLPLCWLLSPSQTIQPRQKTAIVNFLSPFFSIL